jgi:hypothetical protein
MIAALRRAGFDVIRIRGSHHFLHQEDGCRTVGCRFTLVKQSGLGCCTKFFVTVN